LVVRHEDATKDRCRRLHAVVTAGVSLLDRVLIHLSGTCLQFRIAKSAVTRYRAKRKIILVSGNWLWVLKIKIASVVDVPVHKQGYKRNDYGVELNFCPPNLKTLLRHVGL